MEMRVYFETILFRPTYKHIVADDVDTMLIGFGNVATVKFFSYIFDEQHRDIFSERARAS